jgi:hypothetical protein
MWPWRAKIISTITPRETFEQSNAHPSSKSLDEHRGTNGHLYADASNREVNAQIDIDHQVESSVVVDVAVERLVNNVSRWWSIMTTHWGREKRTREP